MFEPFAEVVDEANRLMQALEDLDVVWDQLTPVTQHEDGMDIHDRTPPVAQGMESLPLM